MIFRPTTLAAGWRGVALAASSDQERPALTGLHIEQYPNGVRLVATDSYMLLHTWVPSLEAEEAFDPEPDFADAPLTTTTALDPDGRGKGLLAYAHKLASGKHPELFEIAMNLGVVVTEDEAEPTFAGMEPRWCVVEISERERVKLRIYDGEYPNWRALFAGYEAEETKQVALNLEILGRLAKLPKLVGQGVLGWEFGGSDKAARVQLLDSFPHVEGIVMPCRWDLDTNTPAVDPESKPEAEVES